MNGLRYPKLLRVVSRLKFGTTRSSALDTFVSHVLASDSKVNWLLIFAGASSFEPLYTWWAVCKCLLSTSRF